MKILQIGVIVMHSNGVADLSYWSIDEPLPEDGLSREQVEELINHAKEHGTYIESDILSAEEVKSLVEIKRSKR